MAGVCSASTVNVYVHCSSGIQLSHKCSCYHSVAGIYYPFAFRMTCGGLPQIQPAFKGAFIRNSRYDTDGIINNKEDCLAYRVWELQS